MEIEENLKITYKDNNENKIKIELSLINNKIIKFKLIFNNNIYIKQFDSYDFNWFDYFNELSSIQIYKNLKEAILPKNIQIEKEKDNSLLKITISIKTEFDKENFIFYASKVNNQQIINNKEENSDFNDKTIINEVIFDKENNPDNYIVSKKDENKEKFNISNNFPNNQYTNNNYNYYNDEDDSYNEYLEMKNERIKKLSDLQNNTSEKEKIETIKKNYLYKSIFCHLCHEYTYINKIYKASDDFGNNILVKYYCSESHEDHCCTLIDFLFLNCKNEIYDITEVIRDGKKMKLTNDELTSIKNKFKLIQEKVTSNNKKINYKVIQDISKLNNLTEFQNKLYQKYENIFNNNQFINEMLFYFIQMIINTYEEAFNNYPSQAIICTLRNYTDFIDNFNENIFQLDIKNDVTKYLLNAINYFKNNYILKIYEPEIDLSKIKNKANITISNDSILCLKYLNKYKTLLAGSTNGKIYCINIDEKKCFCQIQAHKEEEEKRGNWGIWYINEIEGNRLITCCEDSTMKLWEIINKTNENKKYNIDIKYITVIRGHRDMVRKVIQLKNNNNFNKNIKLATCSFDCCLGFWEEKSKNKFELLKLIQSHNFWINEIHEIYDGRIFAIGGEHDPYLKIWNPDNYNYDMVSHQIFCVNHDCIIDINKDYYIIGGNHTYLYLFRLSGKMVVRVIYIDKMYINSLLLLPDGNLLADSGKNMIKYVDLGSYKTKDVIKSNGEVNWLMYSLNNKTFITSDRQCIKIWEY